MGTMEKKGLEFKGQLEQADQNDQRKGIRIKVDGLTVDNFTFEYSYESLRRLMLSAGATLFVLTVIILTAFRLIFG